MLHAEPQKQGIAKEIPSWALIGIGLIVVIGLVVVLCRALLGTPDPAAGCPPLKVHPGMYNLREEIEKGQAAKANAGQHP